MNELDQEKNIENLLEETAEQIQPNLMFKAELEEKLRKEYRPNAGFFSNFSRSITANRPTLTGIAALGALVIVIFWIFQTIRPQSSAGTSEIQSTPESVIDPQNSTSEDNGESYDYREGKLVLTAPLPEAPASANIYTYRNDQPATQEEAQALADKFGLKGDTYKVAFPQSPEQTGYVISDGKRILTVYTKNYFTYTPDIVVTDRGYYGVFNENAEAIIFDFFKANGFDLKLDISESPMEGIYQFAQVSPDDIPMQYDIYTIQGSTVTLDKNGEVANLTANLMSYDQNPAGTYDIISAKDALDAILDPNSTVGMTESGSSGGSGEIPQQWYREYPNNETVTISGSLIKYDAATPGQPPLIFIGSTPAIGNIEALKTVNDYTFVQATGQFLLEDGVRKFNVETADVNSIQGYISGSLRQEGSQILLIGDDGKSEYILLDPPADLPLNTKIEESYIGITGALIENTLDWSNIQYIADASSMGGGGGGGGYGFYPLNLTGTPAVFPTPIPSEDQYSPAEISSFLNYTVKSGDTLESIAATFNVPLEDLKRVNYITDLNVIQNGWIIKIPGVPGPTQLEGAEGIVNVYQFKKPDGRLRYQYNFVSVQDSAYYELTGDELEPLQKMINRPVKIWGDISFSENGSAFLDVKQYEELYPGLQYQILQGKETVKEINGYPMAFFTTGNDTYVILSEMGTYQDISFKGDFPEGVSVEALIVPGETYEGMPAIRVFNMVPATNPTTGLPLDIEPMANKILPPGPDPYGNSDEYIQPDLIVDSIQLEYYVSDPKMLYDSPTDAADGQYIQPVWHFHGHYIDGAIIDILVQALKREYLSPYESQ